jgi:hypothetical protein
MSHDVISNEGYIFTQKLIKESFARNSHIAQGVPPNREKQRMA